MAQGKMLSQQQRSKAIHLAAHGKDIHEIARELACSAPVVEAVLRGTYNPSRVDVTEEDVAEMVALTMAGLSSKEVGERTGWHPYTVRRAMARAEFCKSGPWDPGPARLSMSEREQVRVGLAQDLSLRAIAADLGRAPSTVSREVAANGGRAKYRAWAAHGRAQHQARRPKPTKFASCPRLAEKVSADLVELWSPEQISQRLRSEFGDDPMMRVSHETIYRALYVQGRGALRKELAACLRTGRAARRPRGRIENRGRTPGMIMISERPAEVADRAVPGHWEGDLIVGTGGRSYVGTLVERTTRYLLLLHLSDGRAETVNEAMKLAIATLPTELFKSLTWDQGAELSRHGTFSLDTGIQVYFCDPHSPWQRGSNENTNGLLRQYLPKKTDLSVHSTDDLARIARSLNNRPRKTLGYMTPCEKMAELLR